MKKYLVVIALIIGVVMLLRGISRWNGLNKEDNILPSLPSISLSSVIEAEKAVILPFYTRPESEFGIANVYYVATNESGASNDNNGLYPTYRGGKDGPFKDLTDSGVRSVLLDKSDGVKLVIRQGTYKLVSDDPDNYQGGSGLVLRGKGDEFHPVILTAYPGEKVILDGGEKLPRDELRRIAEEAKNNKKSYRIKIRQAVQLEGQYNIVENLTIRDGWRHNVASIGKYSIIRNNKLEGAYEDSIKLTQKNDYGSIYKNDISGFGSQAVDNVGASNWLIKGNNIYNPGFDPISGIIEASGLGNKGGVRNLVVVDNFIHDFKTNHRNSAIAGGGAIEKNNKAWSGEGPSSANIIIARNKIYNYLGPAVGFGSCHDCMFTENIVYNTFGGVYIGFLPEQNQELDISLSKNIVIRNNTFAGNYIGVEKCSGERGEFKVGDVCYLYYIADSAALKGFSSENNKYYTDTSLLSVSLDAKRFINREEFIDTFKTDQTSRVFPLSVFKP